MRTVIIKRLRDNLDITQAEMATILGISLKSVQSYEQGWRKIPPYIEKMVLLLIGNLSKAKVKNCWEIVDCPEAIKNNCLVYKSDLGHCCWAISGCCYKGKVLKSWAAKKQVCLNCPVLQKHLNNILK